MTYLPNTTVYCRFTGAAFLVVSCNGCVAILREVSSGYEHARPVGEITSRIA